MIPASVWPWGHDPKCFKGLAGDMEELQGLRWLPSSIPGCPIPTRYAVCILNKQAPYSTVHPSHSKAAHALPGWQESPGLHTPGNYRTVSKCKRKFDLSFSEVLTCVNTV